MFYCTSYLPLKGTTKHNKASHNWTANETPFKWRFVGGPTVARDCMLAKLQGCFYQLFIFLHFLILAKSADPNEPPYFEASGGP